MPSYTFPGVYVCMGVCVCVSVMYVRMSVLLSYDFSVCVSVYTFISFLYLGPPTPGILKSPFSPIVALSPSFMFVRAHAHMH